MDGPGATELRPSLVTTETARLGRAERRDALLDAAAHLVATGEVEDVSMDSVAEVAGVSRALVYKHFTNRQDLLSALYERESAHLHAQLSADVQAADGLAEMLRALVRGALSAQAARGATLAALGAHGGRTRAQRDLQRRRDGRTLRYFARQAMAELGLDDAAATVGLGISLGAIPAVLTQWKARPTRAHAALLVDAYVAMAMGGLKELAGPNTPR